MNKMPEFTLKCTGTALTMQEYLHIITNFPNKQIICSINKDGAGIAESNEIKKTAVITFLELKSSNND